ncbi:oxidoreductase [Actinokineospora auranticolor]|uniref:Aryl-alcohol dehydrogenase-like predicted oxidoreductase n=1 Tax=Actinokineospora auranticolor TaxID=155976 RepID=A0A2S6GT26_9PSEU|nr:oxidoreductase [Actinokineospora auranticolor]PPK68346.1 aryl-alcohol dehydrogenase-like predicted oxidoreductase [Actinokineospora auranticolor]
MAQRAKLGAAEVGRIGYGAMQLAGPGVFGPPRDRDAAIAVLRRAVELGVDHIDTSDYYGPYVVNELIATALRPYPDDLVIVTKVGARRDDAGAWLPALSADELRSAVHDNLTRLGVDRLDVVNLRLMDDTSLEEPLTALAELRAQGLVAELGVSNVTSAQLAQARGIAPIACVQNMYNVTARGDDALVDETARLGIAYVPFFPLGGFEPFQADVLDAVAARHGATDRQVALAWLLRRSPNILLIPGTSSVAHLEQNLTVTDLELTETDVAELDGLAAAG